MEEEKTMMQRKYLIVDGYHRVVALQNLRKEDENYTHILPKVCVLRSTTTMKEAIILARHYNRAANTLVKETYFDKIWWLKRMMGGYLREMREKGKIVETNAKTGRHKSEGPFHAWLERGEQVREDDEIHWRNSGDRHDEHQFVCHD